MFIRRLIFRGKSSLQRYSLPSQDAVSGRFRNYVFSQEIQGTNLVIRSPFPPGIAMWSILVQRKLVKRRRACAIAWRNPGHDDESCKSATTAGFLEHWRPLLPLSL